MARERESFRDQLQSLQAKFPEQEVLTKDEACKPILNFLLYFAAGGAYCTDQTHDQQRRQNSG